MSNLGQHPSLRARVLGAVVGAAIGDAMGHPTEFLDRGAIEARFGREGVRGFELFWERDGKRFAPYTDDTQMAEVVLRALIGQHHILEGAMTAMAEGFVDWSKNPQGGHRAPGNACMSGCRNLAAGVHWSESGGATAGGCGSVMRAYPFGLLFWQDLAQAEKWAVEHSKLTHRDPIALAACAAMAFGVAMLLSGAEIDVVLGEMARVAARYSEPTSAMILRAVEDGQGNVAAASVLERLQGWAAHEAIAAAAFVVARHPTNIADAILEGANAAGDSDSIATLAGALMGARHGVDSLPVDWVRDLERTTELLALAHEAADAIGAA